MLKIYLIGNKTFVWNAEDAMKLRKEHHIVGSLTGICPIKSFQVQAKWLPLQLMPEEAKLLLDKDIACLILSPEKITDSVLIESYLTHKGKLCEEQAVILKQNRQKIILEKADEIYAGKKRKLLEISSGTVKKANSERSSFDDKTAFNEDKSHHEMVSDKTLEITDDPVLTISREKKSTIDDSSDSFLHSEKNITDDCKERNICDKEEHITHKEITIDEEHASKDSGQDEVPIPDKEAVITAELAKIPDIDQDICMVQLFTECPMKNTLAHGKLTYPSTEREKLRYAVFKDLWEKKFYVTSGVKFGGDFLIYEGDPIKYHASCIVVCLSDNFQALDILTYGRLGHQVKKTVALASLNESGTVEFITLNWSSDLS